MTIPLVERHLEEVGFLWTQRELAVHAANHDLASLVSLDDRLEANLDGLRVGGAAAWEACRAALDKEPGAVFAATALALANKDLAAIAEILSATAAMPRLADGLVAALVWHGADAVRPVLERCLSPKTPPLLKRIGLAACAARRFDPGRAVDDALGAADPALSATALHAAGVLGKAERLDGVRKAFASPDASVRVAAVWSGALLRDAAAETLLWEMARGQGPCGESSSALAGVLDALAQRPSRDPAAMAPRFATRYAGATGDLAVVPWLVAKLASPADARIAGEALTTITGAELDRPPLLGRAPEGFSAGPNDDPADANVAMDPDEPLPWPDAEAVARWWRARGESFGAGRHLLGRPLDEACLEDVLRRGRQRQRELAALGLKLRRPGRPLFNVRAPARRQARALGLA